MYHFYQSAAPLTSDVLGDEDENGNSNEKKECGAASEAQPKPILSSATTESIPSESATATAAPKSIVGKTDVKGKVDKTTPRTEISSPIAKKGRNSSPTTSKTSKAALALRQVLEHYKVCDVVRYLETLMGIPSSHGDDTVHRTNNSSFREGSQIIELDSSMTPLEASTVLWEGNVLGAPVWDEREQRYVGFFDMRNMLQVITESATIVQHNKLNAPSQQQQQLQKKKGPKFHSVFANELNRSSTNNSSSAANAHGNGTKSSSSPKPPPKSSSAPAVGAASSTSYNETFHRNESFDSFTYTPHHHHYANSFRPTPIDEISTHYNTINAIASKHRFYSCNRETNLDDLCLVLSMLGCHRMPIVDDRRVVSIISQSALVTFLNDKLHPSEKKEEDAKSKNDVSQRKKLNPSLDETLDEAGLLYQRNVISVKHTQSALETFQILLKSKLSGVAVIDAKTDKLVDCTSAKDIKRAALDEGRTSMDLPIWKYLQVVRENELEMQEKRQSMLSSKEQSSFHSEDSSSLVENNSQFMEEMDQDESEQEEEEDKYNGKAVEMQKNNNGNHEQQEQECRACHIQKHVTVGEILSILARTKSHRVFVVDECRKPIGVVSVTNIINFALGRPQIAEDHPMD